MKIGIRALLVLAVCAVAIPVWAESIAPEFTLSIPRQSLKSTLIEFSRQTGLVVSYLSKSDETEDQLVGPLNGRYTIESALKQILKDSELVFTRVGEARIAITLRGSAVSAGQLTDPSSDVTHGAKPQVHQLDGSGELASQTERRRIRAANGDTPVVLDAAPREIEFDLPEVLVTGTRILNRDIKRSRDDIQPYVVFDRKMIAQAQVTTVEEFLKQRLTMATSPQAPNQQPSALGNVSRIALRGLRAEETLILIDGRRAGGFALSGQPQQADLNGIPMSAVERIEVLPTTASAIYGGSATGGVINVVLRRDYEGVETRLTYGNTFDAAAASRRVDATAGISFDEGRTTVLVAGSYMEADPLDVGERDFVQKGRQRIMENNPSTFLESFVPPLGATTNIQSAFGDPLTLKDGTPLNSTITYIPAGYSGVASDDGAALVANAGSYNLALANTAQSTGGALQSLAGEPTLKSLMVTLKHEFTPNLHAFLDLSGSENSTEFLYNPESSSFLIFSFSDANPFNEDIFVTTPLFGLEGPYQSKLEQRRGVIGATYNLPARWQLGADYTWQRTRFSNSSPGILAFDPNLFTTEAENAIDVGEIDIMRDTNVFPVDFSPYAMPRDVNPPNDATFQEFALQGAGPLFSLPGGLVTLTARAEHRRDSYDRFSRTARPTRTTTNEIVFGDRSQEVDSLYVESGLPLVGAANDIPAIHDLDLRLAVRWDRYEVTGSNLTTTNTPVPLTKVTNKLTSTDPFFGLRYRPLPDVTIRAQYGTGFLPPQVHQLVPDVARPVSPFLLNTLRDPLRGGERLGVRGPVTISGGGNPDLDPEDSKTWSAGVIFQPRFAAGLRISADWIKIEKRNEITLLTFNQQNINNELGVPGLIERGPVPVGDPFAVGPITQYRSRFFNIARRDAEAIDFALDYNWSTQALGGLSFAAAATHQLQNETQVFESSPMIETVGYRNGLEWQGNAVLSWDFQGWSAAWATRYYDSYVVGVAGFPNDAFVADQGSETVPTQTYHDLFVSYNFGERGGASFGDSILSGLQIQLAVKNIFDKEPPIDVTDSFNTFYSPWGDPRLASYSLTVRKAF